MNLGKSAGESPSCIYIGLTGDGGQVEAIAQMRGLAVGVSGEWLWKWLSTSGNLHCR